MIKFCAWEKDKTTIYQEVDGFFIFTLTYRGGEASFGRERADQQEDGEAGGGARDPLARNMHGSAS